MQNPQDPFVHTLASVLVDVRKALNPEAAIDKVTAMIRAQKKLEDALWEMGVPPGTTSGDADRIVLATDTRPRIAKLGMVPGLTGPKLPPTPKPLTKAEKKALKKAAKKCKKDGGRVMALPVESTKMTLDPRPREIPPPDAKGRAHAAALPLVQSR